MSEINHKNKDFIITSNRERNKVIQKLFLSKSNSLNYLR